MSLCLTPEELADLTEAKTLTGQIAWLTSHSWIYELSKFGRPKVARAYFERRMGVVAETRAQAQTEPDWQTLAA